MLAVMHRLGQRVLRRGVKRDRRAEILRMGGTARAWRLDVVGWLGGALILACGAGAMPAEAGDSARVDTPHAQIQIDRQGLYRVDVAPERQQTLLIVREGEARIGFAGGTRQ